MFVATWLSFLSYLIHMCNIYLTGCVMFNHSMDSSSTVDAFLSPESTVTSLLSSSGHLRSILEVPECNTTFRYKYKVRLSSFKHRSHKCHNIDFFVDSSKLQANYNTFIRSTALFMFFTYIHLENVLTDNVLAIRKCFLWFDACSSMTRPLQR